MKMKKGFVTAIIAILCLSVVGGVSAFAYYMGTKTLNQTNTITIGQETVSIVLGAGQGTQEGPLYPGESVSFMYTVDIEGVEGDVTASASVDQPDDFDVTIVNNEGDAALEGNKVTDGMTIKVTVTMKNSVTEVPDYGSITLTVSLSDPTASE